MHFLVPVLLYFVFYAAKAEDGRLSEEGRAIHYTYYLNRAVYNQKDTTFSLQ